MATMIARAVRGKDTIAAAIAAATHVNTNSQPSASSRMGAPSGVRKCASPSSLSVTAAEASAERPLIFFPSAGITTLRAISRPSRSCSRLTVKAFVSRTNRSVRASFSIDAATSRGLKDTCITQSAIIRFRSPEALTDPITCTP